MLKRILLTLIGLVLFYTIVGFFAAPVILKSVLTKNLTESLHRQVTIEDIDINPYMLSATLRGLDIKDPAGGETFSSLEELFINLQASSIIKQALIVKEIRLQGPYLKIIRTEGSTYNFSDLVNAAPEKKETEKKPLAFFLGNIQITKGRIDVVDSPRNKKHTITDIACSLPFLSNIGKNTKVFVQPHFEATINGTRTVLEGKSKPFDDSLETVFQVKLKGISIPYYMEYLPRQIRLKIPSGTLDLDASITYTQFKDKSPALSTSGTVDLKDLMVTDTKDLPIVRLPHLVIEVAPSQIIKRSVHLADIGITSPEVHITKDKDGTINLSRLVKNTPSASEAEKKTDSKGLSLIIDKASLKGGTVFFSDASASEEVKITASGLDISAQNISSDKDTTSKANVSCRLNKTGSLSADAAFGIDPLFCDAKIALSGIEPAWVQSYFTDKVSIMISKGSASTKGTLALKNSDKKGFTVSYKGDASLVDFSSVGKKNSEELVSWKRLSLQGMDVGVNPTYVNIKEIALDDSSSRIIVNADGSLNLSTIINQPAGEKAPKSGHSEPEKTTAGIEKIRIEKISLNNANISFLDKSISPHYTTSLTSMTGSVSGLTSEESKTAVVNLSAKLDNTSPILIKGKINPLKKDLFVDLNASLKDIDLVSESPYAGKYLGYMIQKGKLSLDLTYLIDKKKLDSQNNIFIDQFTFGDPVESHDKTSLPVRFAVSLLKDPQGKINLELPVSGRTDDPEFRVGKIILQMLVNIIKKAATSPFSALAAMYPGANDLSYVEFQYGRGTLPPGCDEKFGVLLKILTDKPSLTLEIRGFADREHDREGLIRYFFEKKLKSQKLMDMLKNGSPAIAVDDITIKPDEFEHYLKKAYAAETFEKPKNALGFTKSLPAEEMEKLIIEHIEVGDDDLRLLASQRAQQVKNCLIKSQQVNPERIFLVKEEPLSPEKIEGVVDSRVNLNLK